MDDDPYRSAKGFVEDESAAEDPCSAVNRLFMKSELDCCDAGVKRVDRSAPPLNCASAWFIAKDKLLLLLELPVEFVTDWLEAVELPAFEVVDGTAGDVSPLAF